VALLAAPDLTGSLTVRSESRQHFSRFRISDDEPFFPAVEDDQRAIGHASVPLRLVDNGIGVPVRIDRMERLFKIELPKEGPTVPLGKTGHSDATNTRGCLSRQAPSRS
jgi:hypothetical protein